MKLGTSYRFRVFGRNKHGDSELSEEVLAYTAAIDPSSFDDSDVSDSLPVIIIVTVSAVGMILLGINVLLVLYFIRRKRNKKFDKGSVTRSDTEIFNAPTLTEDSKSYTSYGERALDDFPDEFYKPHEVHPRFYINQVLYPKFSLNCTNQIVFFSSRTATASTLVRRSILRSNRHDAPTMFPLTSTKSHRIITREEL